MARMNRSDPERGRQAWAPPEAAGTARRRRAMSLLFVMRAIWVEAGAPVNIPMRERGARRV
jgi:hypothetical protein